MKHLFWGVFDNQCMLISDTYITSLACCDWVKRHYTYDEWISSEFTVNQISVDSKGFIQEFTAEINPFD